MPHHYLQSIICCGSEVTEHLEIVCFLFMTLFTLCDKQVLWESAGAFLPRDNSLVSACKSHSSGVRGLVVRCLPFNPEGSCSNPCVCANFFKQIFRSRRFSIFRHYETPPFFGFVRLFFESFLMSSEDPPFIFFDTL